MVPRRSIAFWPRIAVVLVPAGLFGPSVLHAQCGAPIAAFPYSEGFEAGPAWTSGGVNNDWAWGTPAHPLINSAGGGTKSWCVGGLTGTFYALDERSYLESPCFDFTTLNNPRISFKLFWEVERKWDALVFQYSLDQGATYANVGAFGDATDCLTAYWFNTNDVSAALGITPTQGWSGRQGSTQGSCLGGNGSQAWVTAKHCLGWLAHQPSVRFRFFFGSGGTCNNYDGIAVDDILIEESDPVVAPFDFACNGNTIDFTSFASPCPNTFAWNFGDPPSGALDQSPQQNPSHTYPGPGTYTVTFTATDACGATATTQQDISILAVDITAQDPVCGQDNGSLTAVPSGTNGPVNYFWTPGGATTASLTGMGPGTYSVTVSAPGACAANATATLVGSPSTLALALQGHDVSCAGLADGNAVALATGGVEPYQYAWSDGAGANATATGLAAGTYTCTVTDDQHCTADASVTIAEPPPLTLAAEADVTICAGTSVTLTAEALGGTPPYALSWAPEGSVVTPVVTTTYTVTATDDNGCVSASDDVTVTVSTLGAPAFTSTDVRGCAPHCITFAGDPPGLATYVWDFGDGSVGAGEGPVHCYTSGGLFPVTLTITDAAGCTATATVPDYADIRSTPIASFSAQPPTVTVDDPLVHFANGSVGGDQWLWQFGDPDSSTSTERAPDFTYRTVGCFPVRLVATTAEGCTDAATGEVCVEDPFALYVPNSFTPDNDGINDRFGVITSVRRPRDFSLQVFDRWGRVQFSSGEVDRTWDGDGVPGGVYVWKVRITDVEDRGHERTGHVVLLR